LTAEHYHALYRWFDAHPAARRFVVALDRWLPLVPFVCYPVLLCLLNVRLVQLFLTRQSAAPDLMSEIARSILVPGITLQGYLPRRMVPPLGMLPCWSAISAITLCLPSGVNSLEFASL
jgi:hypothetical protein